jgi:hypothetical protein
LDAIWDTQQANLAGANRPAPRYDEEEGTTERTAHGGFMETRRLAKTEACREQRKKLQDADQERRRPRDEHQEYSTDPQRGEDELDFNGRLLMNSDSDVSVRSKDQRADDPHWRSDAADSSTSCRVMADKQGEALLTKFEAEFRNPGIRLSTMTFSGCAAEGWQKDQ